MKIEIGSGTKNIETKTPHQFTDATRNPLLSAKVFSVTTAREHADLIQKLGSTVRPYALCLLMVK